MPDHVLLTGASGFVGGKLHGPLTQADHSVRCLSRNLDVARKRQPTWDWRQGDLNGDEEPVLRALSDCAVAYYLVHGMGSSQADWVEKEMAAAERFGKLATRAGVGRVIYLGGVAPQGTPSPHLRARLQTGEALRSGSTPCLELRAGMIVGHGSISWQIVRDLAARLPAMVVPAWLGHRSEPVALADVLSALTAAATVPLPGSRWEDLPGPETLSGYDILLRVARLLGRKPWMLRIPLVTPRLSSHWIRLVTRADYRIARELVEGLTCDLVAEKRGFWEVAHVKPMALEQGAQVAFAEEQGDQTFRAKLLEALAYRVSRKV